MANLLEKVALDIIAAIKNDSIVLPTLPEVALRVRDIAEDINCTIPQLAKVMAMDAALSARVIKVANSPLVRSPQEVTDLGTAIARLGINFTANLAVGLAMEQMFQATTDVVDKRMRSLWSHSMEVASISHVLAQHYTKLQPDQALLGGLVHKIGALPILAYAEDHGDLLSDAIALDKLIEKLHPKLGEHILTAWKFPKELRNVPGQYLKFDRVVDKVDYADVVMVANLQSFLGTDHAYTKMDWNEISAFKRLGLAPNIEVSEALQLDEGEDIKSLLS